MGKKTNILGYSVHVNPFVGWTPNAERHLQEMKRNCERIVEQIKRHCDDVENVFVKTDREEVCEHCGDHWAPSSSGRNECCDKDDAEHVETPRLLESICPVPPIPSVKPSGD